MRTCLKLVCLLLICTIFSCSKSDSELSPDESRIYFDNYYNNVENQTTVGFYSKRFCYDLNNDKVIWEKDNSVFPEEKLLYFNNKNTSIPNLQYSPNASINGSLIRIFAYTDPMHTPPYADFQGVYFQKVNAGTGDDMLKIIVPKSELSGQHDFCISRIENDGNYLYFACNNGNFYCVDANGNIVWKKNIGSVITYKQDPLYLYGGYQSFFHLDDGKIFINVKDYPGYPGESFMVCLKASNGELLGGEGGSYYKYPFITSGNGNKMIHYGIGGASVVDRLGGETLFGFTFYGNMTNSDVSRGLKMYNDSLAAFIDYTSRLSFYNIVSKVGKETGIYF